jgi:hypothetical protein
MFPNASVKKEDKAFLCLYSILSVHTFPICSSYSLSFDIICFTFYQSHINFLSLFINLSASHFLHNYDDFANRLDDGDASNLIIFYGVGGNSKAILVSKLEKKI